MATKKSAKKSTKKAAKKAASKLAFKIVIRGDPPPPDLRRFLDQAAIRRLDVLKREFTANATAILRSGRPQ
jgi:hypothetical protein